MNDVRATTEGRRSCGESPHCKAGLAAVEVVFPFRWGIPVWLALWLGVAAAGVGGGVRAAEPSPPFLTQVIRQTVLCKQPGRYIGWPTITQAANGDLLVVFSGDRAAHVSPDGKTQMVRSRDGGESWGEPRTIHDFRIDDRDAGILTTSAGTLIASWFTGPPYGSSFEGHYVRRSTDHGYTWGAPIRTGVTSPHGPVELKDGRLLYLGLNPHCSHTKPQNYNGPPASSPHRITVEESRDDGRSWQEISRLEFPPNSQMLSFDEPHLVETADGRLVGMFRDCNAPNALLQTESRDGGRSWSLPQATPIRGYPPHLLRLKNNWLLVTYAKRWAPYGQYACISRDHGKTWDVEHEIHLRAGLSGDLGYPATVELGDGAFFTVYYQIDKAGEPPSLLGTHWRMVTP